MKAKREIPAYIGKNLDFFRQKKGLTQETLCRILNLTRSTYAYYETGKTLPSIMFLKELATFYKVTMEELLDESLEERHKWTENGNPEPDAVPDSDTNDNMRA